MAAFPRRRSLWLKAAVLGTTVWLTICFLLYTEDRTAPDVQGLAPSGVAAPQIANDLVPVVKQETAPPVNRVEINQPSGPEQGAGVLAAPKEQDPGEMGRPVVLPTNLTAEVKKLVDDGWMNNAFNQYVSDLISVHRSLPDPRDEW
ncbi:hypothetical protein G9C98_001723 [Cotesia typhae]|uniref:Polypeptide N-acetylgalactosaminyltransferase 9 n=2 Tax=Cotesia typhae TaxID=2053667 RepID=A0A8J5QKE8_9HYME|nr:hypothetical protein G9C98_001723 [Cotesia typhae]